MVDLLTLNEHLILVDIFRFLIKKGDAANIDSNINHLTANDTNSPRTSNKIYNLVCLDLSQVLADKKVIDDSDEKPWDKVQQILFERLMIEDYGSCQTSALAIKPRSGIYVTPNFEPSSPANEFNPSDGQILRYLYGCFFRLQQISTHLNTTIGKTELEAHKGRIATMLSNVEGLILDQVALYITEPDLFPDREKRIKNNQEAPLLLNLISHFYSKGIDLHIDNMQKFVNAIGELGKNSNEAIFESIIGPSYARLSQKFVNISIDDPSLQEWILVTKTFVQHPELAKKFLERNTLKKDNSISYQSTLLGFMISTSHLPRPSKAETSFFNNPTRSGESTHRFTETQLGIKLQSLCQELHKLFHSLLKTTQTRNLFLSWMGRCLHTFKDRKKLWSNQVLMQTTTISVNDGFLMNFMTIMLHLSEPFLGPYNTESSIVSQPNRFVANKKMLKIDPMYCRWSTASCDTSKAQFLGLADETFLVNVADKSPTSQAAPETLNFISECFFGAHQAFTYGFRSVYERFFKLAQNINELQHAYADAVAQPAPSSMSGPSAHELLKERIDTLMTQFFNLKAILMIPSHVRMQLHFCIATATYLNHLVMCNSYEEATSASDFKQVTVEAIKERKLSKSCLVYMPEMLVENILDFFVFLKHFNDQALSQATDMLGPLMTMIITFMGNSGLMQNPHLRARFAEILECLMPHQLHHGSSFVGCAELFDSHPLNDQLVASLVNVFVSIEMTGEGVQFEQKFSYRRPMYLVLEYLWERPLHRHKLIELAEEAERNIESSRPPLFLRFINLLMNDAIFLLDEALNYMNQLKEAERKRKSGELNRLNPQQRMQADANYAHIGRLARFHNVLSLNTIGTLAWLTSEIKTIFCHPTLVDRIANMLNYFLEHLVGPKKGKFNVSDKDDYDFKPREILEKICKIYINLGSEETHSKYQQFCTAISSDGRSYSENLLPQAAEILFRTGMSSLGTEFEKLSQLIRKIAVRNQMDEIASEELPDSFLDPIMSTVMTDPVLLPTSNIVVDRSTIARHLLSDQTDPFNRAPLSMEDVVPEEELKRQIETFLREKREQKRAEMARRQQEQQQQQQERREQ